MGIPSLYQVSSATPPIAQADTMASSTKYQRAATEDYHDDVQADDYTSAPPPTPTARHRATSSRAFLGRPGAARTICRMISSSEDRSLRPPSTSATSSFARFTPS